MSDAEDLVAELSSHGLLLVSDQPISGSGSPAKETP
jgi:hypothetical protein